jgi:S-adenosylmethionine uptake transporter
MSQNTLTKLPLLGWFMNKGYAQGAFWATMICLVSVSNDILMRLLGENLHVVEIIFFRFLFGMITIVPLMLSHGTTLFKTQRPVMHIVRAIIGVGGIGACCLSVNLMPLSDNTTIMFSQPLFFLPMAVFLLREHVDFPRWMATLIGFVGLMIIVQPGTEAFRLVALVPITAALLFATLDIMAKKMVSTENTYNMMFYFAVGTTLAALGPAIYFWKMPSLYELGLLALLGVGGNLIQACIFRAFTATDASALMPFRYVEFIFSAGLGFLFFTEIPTMLTVTGAIFIIAGTFYISYAEKRKERQAAEAQANLEEELIAPPARVASQS